jgi:hypothetical protein
LPTGEAAGWREGRIQQSKPPFVSSSLTLSTKKQQDRRGQQAVNTGNDLVQDTHKPALAPAQAQRLIKLLGLLGSDHDGEVAAAGRHADRLVRESGLTWSDIIAVKRELEQRFPRVRAHRYERSINATLRDGAGVLSQWEVQFLNSLLGRNRFTDKQASKFSEILYKVAQARRSAA